MPVQIENSGGIARLTLDRPEKLNALDPPLIAALTSAVEEVSADPDLRAVILTGAGEKAFCGGADIGHMAGLTPETARQMITSLHRAFAAIRACPAPVIAAVNGYCLGAGMELAAACDLRIGADSAVYGMPEVKVGLPSVVEAALLPRHLGQGRAAWLVLTGETIDAAKADAWGFTEETAPAERLMDAAQNRAEQIAQCGRQAVKAQKRLTRIWEDAPHSEAVAKSIEIFGAAFETDEPKRMLAAAVGKG
ncbi:MAG: enoyl-CoA hydratase [Pseudomonadota bacterium]